MAAPRSTLRFKRWLMLPVFFCLSLAACAGNSSITITTSGLVITQIAPSSAPAGSTQFDLQLTGNGLSQSSQVHFGTDVLTPEPVTVVCVPASPCPNILLVVVPAADISAAGQVDVYVSTGTSNSNTVSFQVTALPHGFGPPTLGFISPGVAEAGAMGAATPLIVEASNVSAGVTINFGVLSLTPQAPPTCSPGLPCEVEVVVPGSALATPQTVQVTASNPGTTGGISNAASFTIAGAGTFPMDESVDDSSPPVPGNGPSTHSAVSESGRFVVFDSTAANLTSGAVAGHSQVYLHDNCFGAPASCTPQTTLVSVAAGGGPGAGGTLGSSQPQMTQDGRYIAFQSDDTNLVSVTSQPILQIFVRDTCQSLLDPIPTCTPQTVLVSESSAGVPGNAPSTNPTIAATLSMLVAFQSAATNLLTTAVPAATQQVYLVAACLGPGIIPAGCQPAVAIQSTDVNGNPGDKDSTNPSLSTSGAYLSFESLADNFVANTPGNSFHQIYTRTSCPGTSPNPPPILPACISTQGILAVSLDPTGKLGLADSITPATTLSGAIVFATRAPNLLPAGTSSQQIVLQTECYSTNSTCPTPGSYIVSVDSNGQPGQGDSSHPFASGTTVAYTSLASLLPGISGQQVYVTRACFEAAPCISLATLLLSADVAGNPIGGDFGAGAGPFAVYSSAGASTAPGVSQVLLGAPFLGVIPPEP